MHLRVWRSVVETLSLYRLCLFYCWWWTFFRSCWDVDIDVVIHRELVLLLFDQFSKALSSKVKPVSLQLLNISCRMCRVEESSLVHHGFGVSVWFFVLYASMQLSLSSFIVLNGWFSSFSKLVDGVETAKCLFSFYSTLVMNALLFHIKFGMFFLTCWEQLWNTEFVHDLQVLVTQEGDRSCWGGVVGKLWCLWYFSMSPGDNRMWSMYDSFGIVRWW